MKNYQTLSNPTKSDYKNFETIVITKTIESEFSDETLNIGDIVTLFGVHADVLRTVTQGISWELILWRDDYYDNPVAESFKLINSLEKGNFKIV
jgi:hypothetical protein